MTILHLGIETLISGKDPHHEEVLLQYLCDLCLKQNYTIVHEPWLENNSHPLLLEPPGYLHMIAVIEVDDGTVEFDGNDDGEWDLEVMLENGDDE